MAAVADTFRSTAIEPAVDGAPLTLTPAGSPETENITPAAASDAGATVSTTCPLPACGTLSADGEAVSDGACWIVTGMTTC
jgi:hypothetical protein